MSNDDHAPRPWPMVAWVLFMVPWSLLLFWTLSPERNFGRQPMDHPCGIEHLFAGLGWLGGVLLSGCMGYAVALKAIKRVHADNLRRIDEEFARKRGKIDREYEQHLEEINRQYEQAVWRARVAMRRHRPN